MIRTNVANFFSSEPRDCYFYLPQGSKRVQFKKYIFNKWVFNLDKGYCSSSFSLLTPFLSHFLILVLNSSQFPRVYKAPFQAMYFWSSHYSFSNINANFQRKCGDSRGLHHLAKIT